VSESLLSIENAGYSYVSTQWQLKDVSLEVSAGDFAGIVGPNGSGKSTLVKLAAGIFTPSCGSIKLRGENIRRLSRRKIAQQLGYLPQNVTSAFNYRVSEVVAMGRFPHLSGFGFMQTADLEQVERCMSLTETATYRDRTLSQLSGGERQRVMLASVLAQEPSVLVLDEPTTGLDLHYQVAFFSLLKKLTSEGIAVVVVTHDLNLAGLFCNRLLLLNDGKTVKTGSVEEILTSDVLCGIYPGNIYVGQHPVSFKPMILPVDNPESQPHFRT